MQSCGVEMLDVLVFSPHPDDAELGAGGSLIKLVRQGFQVGLLDLTAGELGTHGTKSQRLEEAHIAQGILGVTFRENLLLPDGYLFTLQNDMKTILTIAAKLREFQPGIVLLPYWLDRHPDHRATAELVSKAIHYAKLAKVKLDSPPHKVDVVLYYELNGSFEPSFLVDISREFELKKKAIMSHQSQFQAFSREFLPFPVEERCRYYGSLINVDYAEAFYSQKPLKISNWKVLLKSE